MLRATVHAHLERVRHKEWGSLVAFDTETDGLHGPLVLASFCDKDGPWTMEPALLYIGDEASRLTIAGHHLAYDLRTLLRSGMEWPKAVYFDTAVAEHLLNEEESFPDLAALALKYLNRALKNWEDVKDDPAALREYAREDARATYDITKIQWGLLAEQGLLDYFFKIEMPLVPIIADMEHRGIAIDRVEIHKRLRDGENESGALYDKMIELLVGYNIKCRREGCVDGQYHWKRGDKVSECRECDGTGFNPVLLSSGDSQRDIFYNHFGLPELKRGRTKKSNKLSTEKATLLRLRSGAVVNGNEPAAAFIDAFLRWRKLEKLSSTYYGPWVAQKDSRLHPSFHQTGTVSGRWSSSKPNFQNVSPESRTCMVPDPGCAFISVDYTQIELYLLAYLSGEQTILDAYAAGVDLHDITAQAAGVDRMGGKTLNFALIYGLSVESLAVRLNTTEDKAKELMGLVLARFTRLDEYKKEVIAEATRCGYAKTILGRKRRLRDLRLLNNKFNGWKIARAERQAVNHTIQGSAGDLIKCAMIKGVLKNYAVPVLQIHDEVIWQTEKSMAHTESCLLQGCFETACRLVNPRAEALVMSERWEAK